MASLASTVKRRGSLSVGRGHLRGDPQQRAGAERLHCGELPELRVRRGGGKHTRAQAVIVILAVLLLSHRILGTKEGQRNDGFVDE